MICGDELHRKVKEDLEALGGRPLHPKGAELSGGYPLSVEARMLRPQKHAGFLGGADIGLWSIDKEIKKKYMNFPAVSSATFSEGADVIKGSNPFYVVAVNEMLREGQRTATPADLGKIFDNEILDLSEIFVDTALVLRSCDRPNEYCRKKLRKQIRATFPHKLLFPIMIPLSELELEPDQNSRHGLAFKLRDYARNPVYAPQLSDENDCKRFSETDGDGLPIFDRKGNRALYTKSNGLSRLSLYRCSYLVSDDRLLEVSNSDGRIVVVSDKA